MKRTITRLPWIVAAVALVALLAYGFLPETIEVETAEVVAGSLEVTVNDDGETRIREKYIVSAPVAGKLLRIQLDEGDVVSCEETELLRIEPVDAALLDARTQAESDARVRASEAMLQQAQAAMKRSEEALELADHELQRANRLLPEKAISQALYDAAEHGHRIAQANVRTAEFATKVAEFELENAKVAAARYHHNDQEKSDEPFRLVSPIDGRVLRVIQEDAGVVEPGTSLLELGDPEDLEIEIDVLSSEAVQIQPGNKLYIDHWGGERSLEAVVRLVEPSAFLKISALGVEEKRVNVIADFVDPWESRKELGDGYRIEARIVVASTDEDSLKIPAGALFRQTDSWHVYRMDDGVARLTPVEVGKTNGLESEIIKGLGAGDVVVNHPTDRVRDGVAVAQIE